MTVIALIVLVWSVIWLHNVFYMGPYKLFGLPGSRRQDTFMTRLNYAAPPLFLLMSFALSIAESRWRAPMHHIDRVFGNLAEYPQYSALMRPSHRRAINTVFLLAVWALLLIGMTEFL